jgi:hypothetical protein
MASTTFFTFPNFDGIELKSGCLQDSNGVNYPVVRFQDEKNELLVTGVSGTYPNNSVIGSKLTFADVAANAGWGGAITGAAINVNNTVLASDTLTLLLFNDDISSAIANAGLLSALSLTDAELDNYIGAIALSNPVQFNGKTVFSNNVLNFKYVCQATSLYGLLVLSAASSRTLSSARIAINLQINKS